MTSITLNVSGMTCGGCENSVRNALLTRPGVHEVTASHTAGTVSIKFDAAKVDAAQIGSAIEAAGFDLAA